MPLRTVTRMFAALILSLFFTLTYATLAAKSRRAEIVLIPLLDVLQSVPILGYLSFTVVFFVSLVPGNVLGPELAAIFAIFTSQAWNMAFSFYQALRTIPSDLDEVSPQLSFLELAALLAARGAVRDAGSHLEYDDVDVGGLVLCRGL
jgi:NitT/TauT family transport system permease protein